MTAKPRSSTSSKKPTSTSSSSSLSSASEISKQIKTLIKEDNFKEERADATRLDELRRLYTKLVSSGELQFGGGSSSPESTNNNTNAVKEKWIAFLMKYHKAMCNQLLHRIQHYGRKSSIRCYFGVIASSPITKEITARRNSEGVNESTIPTTYSYLNFDLLRQWMNAICRMEHGSTNSDSAVMDKAMKHMIQEEFIGAYRDVQYYALKTITILATQYYNEYVEDEDDGNDNDIRVIAEKLLQFLLMVPVPTTRDEIDNKSQYLFPPPKDVVLTESDIHQDEEGKDDEDDDDGFSTEDEDDDSTEDESDEEDEGEGNEEDDGADRPSKRQKVDPQSQSYKFPYQQLRCFRREHQKAWLAILKLPISTSSLKQILQYLPDYVLPNISQPLRFADFFMKAYTDTHGEDSDNEEEGQDVNEKDEDSPSSRNNSTSGTAAGNGIIGVLALNGLFMLLTEYGLEYQNFYKQLYKLVSPRIFHVKYRMKFTSLLTKCLMNNEMLPAHIIASFVKRLCRCTMSIPPSSILSILALVSNLLRKHPECLCLIHRDGGKGSNKSDGKPSNSELFEDCFLATEDDPTKTRALQSSLWELVVLERHYYPAVSTLAKSIGRIEEEKAPMHDIEGAFSHHTYKSLFDQERKSGGSGGSGGSGKKKPQKTSLTFHEPKSLFTSDDIFAGVLKTS